MPLMSAVGGGSIRAYGRGIGGGEPAYSFTTIKSIAEGFRGVVDIRTPQNVLVSTYVEKLNGNTWVAVGVTSNPSVSAASTALQSTFTTSDVGVTGSSNQMFSSALYDLNINAMRFMSSPNIETNNTNQYIDWYVTRPSTVFSSHWGSNTSPDWWAGFTKVAVDTYGRYPQGTFTRFHTANSGAGTSNSAIQTALRSPGSFAFSGDGVILAHGYEQNTIHGMDQVNYTMVGREDNFYMHFSSINTSWQSSVRNHVSRIYFLVRVT